VGENEYFEDTVLEKKFWYRRAKDGWQGLVSEPVGIQWKEGRDLTSGLLSLVSKAYSSSSSSKDVTAEQKDLAKKIENTGMGGLSFFAWFGFIGRRITAEENAAAIEEEKKRRANGAKIEVEGEGDDMEDLELDMSLEIFPDGEELALAFADDLWPGAIKYFSKFSMRILRAFFPRDVGEWEWTFGKAFTDASSQHKHKNKTLSLTPISRIQMPRLRIWMNKRMVRMIAGLRRSSVLLEGLRFCELEGL
jgi:hypothetical protein